MKRIMTAAALAALVATPVAVHAQGIVGDAVNGAVGVAGSAVGAATGIAGGVLGVDTRPRFRDYAARERHPSYRWGDEVRVGAVLPGTGLTYYDVPSDYGVRGYRYSVVNDRYVLVDPATHRIVQVID